MLTTHSLRRAGTDARNSESQPSHTGVDLGGSLSYYATRPLELSDRIRSEFERRREPATPRTVVTVPRLGHEVVHQVLDIAAECESCSDCAGFGAAWSAIEARSSGLHHHDTGLDTVRALWSLVRHVRPDNVVETGVARGVSTAVVLSAMRANERGHLWSIDLPEVNLVRSGQSGAAVSSELRDRWTLLKGGSRRLLPRLLTDITPVDVFVHDSLHTARNIRFELETVWRQVRVGGVVFVDDADCNDAFVDFAASVGGPSSVSSQGNREGAFGLLKKTS